MSTTKKRKLGPIECAVCHIAFDKFIYHEQKSNGEYYHTCPICREELGRPFKEKEIDKPRCVHGKTDTYHCRDCGGKGFCTHNRHKATCKICKGNKICLYNNIKYTCKLCKGASLCPHLKIKGRCRKCKKIGMCVHNVIKHICTVCTDI